MNRVSSHRWNRRQALWLMAGALGGVGLHGCVQPSSSNSNTPTADLTPATMAVTTWIGNTPMYVAHEKQFFRQEGLNLTIRKFNTVAESFPAFSIGQIEGIAPVTSEAVTLAAEGVDYRIVLVEDTSNGADAILARNSIGEIADFKGKRIAVQKGGVGHFFVLQVLAEAGLKESDVRLVDTTPEAAAAAYEAGNVEITYSYPPYLDKALANQQDGRIIYDSSRMPTAIADVYAFNNDFIEANPEAVQAFVNGIMKGLDFLKTNESEALKLAASPLETQPNDLKVQLQGISLPDLQTNLDMLANPQSDLYLLKSLNALAKFLQETGQIDTLPDLSNFIEPRFVQALSRNAS